MPHDAIVGARFMDTVFSSEFTIIEVRAETDEDVADEEDIVVVLDYEEQFDDPVERPLNEFREQSGTYVIEVPDIS
jgi:hypothetical protein